ncbi:MAG: hypothetical protein ISR99_01930 [Parcubacteria group bacterium]|nr:hypothetical protein [Parcubacteria group bacterium]
MRHLIISATLLFIFAINAQALACGNAGVGLKQPIFVKEYHVFTLAPKSGGRMKCGGRHLEGADFRIYWSSQDEAAEEAAKTVQKIVGSIGVQSTVNVAWINSPTKNMAEFGELLKWSIANFPQVEYFADEADLMWVLTRQGSGCDNLANGRAKRTTVGKLDMFTFRYTGPDGLYGCSGSYALIN